MTILYFREGDKVVIAGQRLRVHRVHADRDLITVYSWRDVVARPITGYALSKENA